METIASVKFIGQNITRSGLQSVETKPEVPKPSKPQTAHRSVTYVQSPSSSGVSDSGGSQQLNSATTTPKASSTSGQAKGGRTSPATSPEDRVVGLLKASETQILMHRDEAGMDDDQAAKSSSTTTTTTMPPPVAPFTTEATATLDENEMNDTLEERITTKGVMGAQTAVDNEE